MLVNHRQSGNICGFIIKNFPENIATFVEESWNTSLSAKFARVPQVRSCPPKEGGLCRCGGRYVEGWKGFPYFSKFQSSKVPRLQSFKIICCFCWKILIPHYHIYISCFLEDIDSVIKFSKNITRFSAFMGPILFNILNMLELRYF